MKKRTLLAALLVVPMGIALARSQAVDMSGRRMLIGQDESEAMLGVQRAHIKQGDMSTEAQLGRQQAHVCQGDICQEAFTPKGPRLGTTGVVTSDDEASSESFQSEE